MNLYRLFNNLRSEGTLRARDDLIARLQGKESFTEDDLNEVFAYKRMDYHSNPDARRYTSAAFAARELGEKLRLLKRLNGVGTVTASAILMFQNPYKYAEISHKAWSQLRRRHAFSGADKDHRSDYGVGEYREYLEALVHLANEYGIGVADVEFVFSNVD